MMCNADKSHISAHPVNQGKEHFSSLIWYEHHIFCNMIYKRKKKMPPKYKAELTMMY